tara:strand:- start:5959 stop:6765 length:807 start_codon:yes stop_codon:yes gene_type:complete
MKYLFKLNSQGGVENFCFLRDREVMESFGNDMSKWIALECENFNEEKNYKILNNKLFEVGENEYSTYFLQEELDKQKKLKLKELNEVYNNSKKIIIQNGNTLVISHDTPEREHFIANLPKLPNWNEVSFFGNYKHSTLGYWQSEGKKIYGFFADSIIWSEVFGSLFIDKESKTLIFAQNKRFYDIYKNKVSNAKTISELNSISFKGISNGIMINIKNEAELILEKFKPSLVSITVKNGIKKNITKAIKEIQDENGEIHLIKDLTKEIS